MTKFNQRLEEMLSPERKERIESVLANRTYKILPVLENLYDRGNLSAVLRSAEAFGLQQVHLIELNEKFKVANRVTQGAEKWIDLKRWKETESCLKHLKDRGYQVIGADLGEHSKSISEFDFTRPTAVVFGSEKMGLSENAKSLCDGRMILPMVGFVQSFNISVAAALTFQYIYLHRLRQQGHHGDLSLEEKSYLRYEFYKRSLFEPSQRMTLD